MPDPQNHPDWQRVSDLLCDALDLPPSERQAFLARECGDDEALKQEVGSLLDADPGKVDHLDDPLVDLLAEPPEPELDTIGPYEVVRRLGSGGGGVVYLASRADGEYQQQVAVKVARAGLDAEQALRRFRAERQILANLDHPHIARLWDGGTTRDRRPYFVMEYVDGNPIDEFCRLRDLSIRDRLDLFLKVCDAVQLAHRHLIIHRDLKPSNILVDGEGEPKLLDFGIAKILDPQNAHLATQIGAQSRAMTPQYASPEQMAGGRITTATDVYSLGLVLFELLTGRRPYDLTDADDERTRELVCRREATRPSVALRRSTQDAGPTSLPSAMSPKDLTGDLDAIVLKALRKEPELRYPTVERLTADLVRYLEGRPVEARRSTLPYRLSKLVRRHAKGFAAASVAALLLASLLVDRELQSRKTERARERAEAAATYLAEIFLFSHDTAAEARVMIPREFLDRGSAMLAELDDQPELQVNLMTAVGRGYLRLGVSDAAEPLIEGALKVSRQIRPADDPVLTERLYDLAWLQTDQGRIQEAEQTYRQILVRQERLLGRDHPDLASVHNALAASLMDQGRYEEAAPLFRQALATRRRELGDDHRSVAAIAGNLAATLYYRGHYREAESLFRDVLESTRRRLPEDDGQVVAAKVNLGATLRSRGDFEEANALFFEVLETREGPPTLGKAAVIENIATCYLLQGDVDAARRRIDESLVIYRSLIGEDHPRLARAETLFARILLEQGSAGQAERLLRKAEAVYAQSQMADHWRRDEVKSLLGDALLDQGQYEPAEELLRSSLGRLEQKIGPLALQTQEADARLAAFERAVAAGSNQP